MNIAEAARKSETIRRASWPHDWCVEPTSSELGCAFFSKKELAPRWEPTKEDLISDDWEPFNENGISANKQRERYGLSRAEEAAFNVKHIKETRSCEELNRLIKNGWILLCAVESSQGWLFSLGCVN